MDHAYIERGDGNCCLCGQYARKRWHVITECEITKKLWQRLGQLVEPLCGNVTINVKEMALGLPEKDKEI